MKAKIVVALLGIISFAIFLQMAWAQSVPQLINYQGRLLNSSGQPLDGVTVNLTFSFYSAQSGGALFLSVRQENVLVTHGVYNLLIGSGTITPGAETSLYDVFQEHKDVWLGVKVKTDPEMTPRSVISSCPYAITVDTQWLDTQMDKWWAERLVDSDNDGYTTDDCDNNNSQVHPGALEICDTVDNQCPNDAGYGYVEEGCPGGPTWPELMGSYNTPNYDYDVFVSGNYAYTADGGSGLRIINVTNPAAPVEAGSYDTPGLAYRVYVRNSLAYVADSSGGLQIISVANPASPAYVGRDSQYCEQVVVSGNLAYLGGGNIFFIDNISTPSAPVRVGSYQLSILFQIQGISVQDNFAYLAVMQMSPPTYGLEIINVAQPSTPVLGGSYIINEPGGYSDVSVKGDYAYLSGMNFDIINVATPASPQLVSRLGEYSEQLYIRGNYAYLAASVEWMKIINISDPHAPIKVKTFTTSDRALGIYQTGNYAYVSVYTAGMQIIKVMK